MTRRGFTLIELLVVIAIIGILSSVVLASLNAARSKGSDAGIRDNMSTIATQAALYYDANSNTYGTASDDCTAALYSDTTVAAAVAAMDIDNGGVADDVTCYAADQTFAVSSPRPAGMPSAHWCVDSTGKKCGIDDPITGASCGTCSSQN